MEVIWERGTKYNQQSRDPENHIIALTLIAIDGPYRHLFCGFAPFPHLDLAIINESTKFLIHYTKLQIT